MTEPGKPLPTFLSDLTFSINGHKLAAFPSPADPEFVHLHLACNRYHDVGLFVRLEDKTAKVKCSQALTTYKDGKELCHLAFEPDYPTPTDAGPFEEWVRYQLIKDIDRMLAWHIEGNTSEHFATDNRDHYLALCRDFAALPDFGMTHFGERSFLYDMLGAVYRIATTGTVTEADATVFDRFYKARDENELRYTEQLAEIGLNIAQSVLPNMPKELQVGIAKQVAELFAPYDAKTEPLSTRTLWSLVKPIVDSPRLFRALAQPYLLKLCKTAELAHVLSAAFEPFPDEAEVYIKHGLSLRPESVSLLIAAETFYLQTANTDILAQIRSRISALGITPSDSTDVQKWIDRYTHLTNDFQYFEPKTDPVKTVPELLDIEAKLNQHWFRLLQQTTPLARSALEEELISQNRFLSAGSSSVVGWLRNQHRYQEVVDYMMPLQAEGDLCVLRHKTYHLGFENFLSNGLSCFLDSQDEEHILQAVQLVDALEPILLPWKSRNILYAIGCIAARAGQTQRALTYARQAIEKGQSIKWMAKDTDFRSMWEHPEFIALQGPLSA